MRGAGEVGGWDRGEATQNLGREDVRTGVSCSEGNANFCRNVKMKKNNSGISRATYQGGSVHSFVSSGIFYFRQLLS